MSGPGSLLLVDYSDSDGEADDEAVGVGEEEEEADAKSVVGRVLSDVLSAVIRRAQKKTTTVRYRSAGKAADFTDDSDASSSSSDESASSSSSSADSSDVEVIEKKKKGVSRGPRTKGELKPTELPPIEELHISVPKEECIHIGTIASTVDNLVVVKAFPNTPALDLDSVFFLDNGQRSLGAIFDVFGPVTEPHYAVRFNSSEHIQEKGVAVGMAVFCAPRTKYTSFVFVDQLRKLKGSDASWRHDEEPPIKFMDWSDDEEERRAKREHRQKRLSKTMPHSQVAPPQPQPQPNDNNPFYRRNRRYNPRDYGPIQWNSMHTPPSSFPQVALPPGYQFNTLVRPSAFGHRFTVPPPNVAGQPLPNPFQRPPPQVQMSYSNHAFRLPPPPPPPP